MYVYDRANELAKDIRDSEEFKAYKALKDQVYADETTKNLIKQYRSLQLEAQAAIMAGKEPGEELMDKTKKLGEVLAFNKIVTEFFAAEYKFQTVISDIYKIIADACEFGNDLFAQS